MTGKADAVRAVSQQFKDRTNTVIEGVMAHLRDDNAKEILGPGLSPLIGRGSLKSIVTFALYADVLRMVRDMVMADGEISDEEVQESLGLLSVLAAGFAKVRKEYSSFAVLTGQNARDYLAQYSTDAGLFGHANEATQWAGVELCRNVQNLCDDAGPLDKLGCALVQWAEAVAASDDIAASEKETLDAMRSLVGLKSNPETQTQEHAVADKLVLTKEMAERFRQDPASVDLSTFTSLKDDALAILASIPAEHGDGLLDLSGCETLSGSQLALLRTSANALRCDGITEITEDMAAALKDFTNAEIGFLNVSAIEDEPLRQLSLYSGPGLHLGLESITEKQAEIIAACNTALLSLPSLKMLTEEAAASLIGFNGTLSLKLLPFSLEVRRLLRQQHSLAGWGEVETFAEPICKFCGEKGRIAVFSDMTPYTLLRESDRTATDGWVWNICPACNEGMSDEEVTDLIDSEA